MRKKLLMFVVSIGLSFSMMTTAAPVWADEPVVAPVDTETEPDSVADVVPVVDDTEVELPEETVEGDTDASETLPETSQELQNPEISDATVVSESVEEEPKEAEIAEEKPEEKEKEETLVEANEKVPSVVYATHVQNLGWQAARRDGQAAGTSGQALRLEGITVKLENSPYSGGISYRTHIQNIGWEGAWKSDGQMSGTSGRALRLEAIQIALNGEIANYYDVYYRVHAQNFGWLGWAANGESAGTAGYAYRLEAIEIRLVKKGDSSAPRIGGAYMSTTSIAYQTHVQNVGWQSTVRNGETSGTTGRALRLEGIKLNLSNNTYGGDVQYRTHIQNIGWEGSFKSAGQLSGTTGRAYRLEAIQVKLTGGIANYFDIYYRVHAQNFGWMGWAKNGESAGTEGYAYRLEGIQIQLVRKGAAAPGSTANAFAKNTLSQQYPQATAVLNQLGGDLHRGFNWIAANPYKLLNNWNDSASSRAHADAYFKNNGGDCYDMAAAFYEMAKAKGYNAHQMAGYVPLARGGMGPHSWVEIDMNGGTYVFDPDFQHDTGRNGYMIYYRQSGTWRYSNYYRMN